MRFPLNLVVSVLLVASGNAQDAGRPAPELVSLDRSLSRAQEDKAQGRVDAERYQEFLAKFRADLDATMSRVQPTGENAILHSRILTRLGELKEAAAVLAPALERDPDDFAVRTALSQTRYDQKDYPSALAEANAVLARDPANKDALALKHSSEGRIGRGVGVAGGKTFDAVAVQTRVPGAVRSPEAQALVAKIRDARAGGDTRAALDLAQELMRTDPAAEYAQKIYRDAASDYARARRGAGGVGDLTVHDGAVGEGASPEEGVPPRGSGGMPLWPLLPAAGLGAAAFAVNKSRKTVESEDGFDEDDRPQPGELQRFVAGSILAALAGAGLYLGGAMLIGAATPIATRLMTGPGQQAVRLAHSEAGAMNPGSANAANEIPGILARAIPLSNEVPKMLVRVIPLKDGQGMPPMLGRAGDPHVFVTAAEDIAGIAPGRIAARLGIAPAPRYLIVKFPTPDIGIRTPTQFENPLFLGRGVTSGGAREFQIMNMRIPENAVKEIVEVGAMSRRP